MTVRIRELGKEDFCMIGPEARAVHALRGIDPCMDRIFGAYLGSRLVGMVRVKQTAGGYTVDRVSMVEECRRGRLARRMLEHLIAGLGDRLLWIAAGKDLVMLCWTMGFRPVAERTLPPAINKILGCPQTMKTCGLVPMVRMPEENGGPVRRPPPADPPGPTSGHFLVRRVYLD
jgi:hypothetical protein